MKQHPYAEILRAIADGKEVEWQDSTGKWCAQSADDTLYDIAADDTLYDIAAKAYKDCVPERYRVKPETTNINGIEVPKPLAELQDGDLFWPSFTSNADENWVEEELGDPAALIDSLLKAGLLHSTYEAAAIHAKALISFTRQP